MAKMRFILVFLTASIVALATPLTVVPVNALCGPGNDSDSWSPRPNASITVSGTACPGTNPRHTAACSATGGIVVDSDTLTFEGVDYYQPNVGVRYSETFSIGCGSLTKTYGPFSGDAIPNCAYTDWTVNARDTVTGATQTLYVAAWGQTFGFCPI